MSHVLYITGRGVEFYYNCKSVESGMSNKGVWLQLLLRWCLMVVIRQNMVASDDFGEEQGALEEVFSINQSVTDDFRSGQILRSVLNSI